MDLAEVPFHRYSTRSIADVAPWAMASLGLDSFDGVHPDLPRPGEIERLVILVFDGLGNRQIEEFSGTCPYLSAIPDHGLQSTFPSTTSSALTSLCTGAVPARHGIVGYVFRTPAGMLNVVEYMVRGQDARLDLDPAGLQPMPTVFEEAVEAGATAWVVTADAFQGSGFTNVFLRGGRWRGWRRAEEMPAIVHEVLPVGMRSLVYAYYDGLDTAGHVSGVGSAAYLKELARCDAIAEGIGSSLGRGEALVIISDHGMVNVRPEDRVFVDSELDQICSGVGGEARCRYLYAIPGREAELLAAAESRYGDWAWVAARAEVVEANLLGGTMPSEIAERVGDVIVIAREPDTGLFRPDRTRPYPKGNHGGLTAAEVEIPFRMKVG
ncbi:MAG: hypothetical protein DCC49_04220 [Acidobacteria bacterium]|nr:MAG: hypothetical protein DCC49_04220 [Acidobacteriota bacterium]